jgi:hypothetical protein
MRYVVGFVFVLALGVMGCSETSGSGGSAGSGGIGGEGGSGPATEFVVGEPKTVSGDSPLASCESTAAFTHAEIETWIEINPTNPDNIVGAWIQDAAPVTRGHVAGVSLDGGATWESVVIPGISRCSGGDIESASDPWLAFAANGELYSVALSHPEVNDPGRSAIMVNKSVDGGLSWSDPITIVEANPPQSVDKPSITADPRDECIVHVGWTRFEGLLTNTFVSRTTDCGQTWSTPTLVFIQPGNGIQVVVASDGTVLAFLGTFQKILLKQSSDGGMTWSEDPGTVVEREYAEPTTPDGDTAVRSAGRLFDVAVDRTTGGLSVVWEQVFDETAPVQVAFSYSDDGGTTWSAAIRVDQTPSSESALLEQAFIPAVETSGDGTIGITYYSFENDTVGDARADADYWFVHCHPDLNDCTDAASWSEALRLTPTSFDYLAAPMLSPPLKEGLFLGDYFGLTSQGSDFFAFFSVTTDDDPANALFVPIRGR